MANVCLNYITIQGNPEIIKLVAKDYIGYNGAENDYEFNFDLLCPIPKDLNGDDYSWRIENWGNKWDGSDAWMDVTEDEIQLSVDTAWGPCDKWTYKLIEMCPGLNIYHEYYEGGEGFIGWIKHSEEEGPDDFEDVFYNYSSEPHNYWVTVFEKEYETFDWLDEHIDWKLEDEEITESIAKEIREMIENNASLETLITKCINEEVL